MTAEFQKSRIFYNVLMWEISLEGRLLSPLVARD